MARKLIKKSRRQEERKLPLHEPAADEGDEAPEEMLSSSNDEEGEENEDFAPTDWGKNAENYYDADKSSVDEELSEEDLEAHHAEAQQVLKDRAAVLSEEDFGRMDLLRAAGMYENREQGDVEAQVEEELEATLALLTSSSKSLQRTRVDGSTSEGEKSKIVIQENPELVPLLSDMRTRLEEGFEILSPLLSHISSKKDSVTSEGRRLLETKNQLMMCYITYICYYILLKTSGVSIENHPVLDRLVELRLLMEKLRPIESKLSSQIDKLLTLAKTSASGHYQDETMEKCAPRPELMENEGETSEQEKPNVYKPPKIVAMEYDGEKLSEMQKVRREVERTRRNLERSQLVRQLRREVEDAPMEVGALAGDEDVDNEVLYQLLQKERAKEEMEEENMMRFTSTRSKAEKALQKLQKRKKAFGGGSTLDDILSFADEALDGEKADGKSISTIGRYLDASRKARDLALRQKEAVSGDKGVSFRKIPQAEPKSSSRFTEKVRVDSGGESEEEIVDDIAPSGKRRKILTEEEQRRLPSLQHEEETTDRRGINRKIQKNRGLSRKRSKAEGNPRVHLRQKYEKKVKRHQARHPSERQQNAAGRYSGETTGVRSRVTRSTKLS